MAKLKIVFEDRYVSKKTGEAPLKVMVSHKTETAYIPLDISLKPGQWDPNEKEVIKHPRKKTLNDEIDNKIAVLKTSLRKIEGSICIEDLDVKTLRNYILNDIQIKKIKIEKNTLIAVFQEFIDLKKGNTKKLYESTLNKIKKFEGPNIALFRFEQVSVGWLLRFNDFLAETAPSANARAIDMRNLRAVVNYAIDNEITNNYPFRRFKIKQEQTRKRNFDVDTLREIFNVQEIESWAIKYRDLFKLSFMLIGINFVDLCNLKEIRNGRIEYIREKTHKLYSIKVEPEIAELISCYKGKNQLLNYMDTYKGYRHFYNNTCKGLSYIKDKLNEKELHIDTLTTYWARHSWATIAASLDIPKETIAAALGHSCNSVTDIYIEFDRRKVDEANRRVLNYVLYGYENGIAPSN